MNAPSVQLKLVDGGQHFLSASHPKVSAGVVCGIMASDICICSGLQETDEMVLSWILECEDKSGIRGTNSVAKTYL